MVALGSHAPWRRVCERHELAHQYPMLTVRRPHVNFIAGEGKRHCEYPPFRGRRAAPVRVHIVYHSMESLIEFHEIKKVNAPPLRYSSFLCAPWRAPRAPQTRNGARPHATRCRALPCGGGLDRVGFLRALLKDSGKA